MTVDAEHQRLRDAVTAAEHTWRETVSPNYPLNMAPHERDLAVALDELWQFEAKKGISNE